MIDLDKVDGPETVFLGCRESLSGTRDLPGDGVASVEAAPGYLSVGIINFLNLF